jgi:hypothetical protein
VFFPEPKRVKFGVDEEIVTTEYTARHVDLSSSSEDEASTSGSDSGGNNASNDGAATENGIVVSKLSSKNGDAVIVDELQRGRRSAASDSRKRITRKKRRWEWTLGSLESRQTQASEETSLDELQRDAKVEDHQSPYTESTSSSPTVATPSTPNAVELKDPEVTVTEVIPTPISATAQVKDLEQETAPE